MRIAWYSPLLETAELKSAAFTSRLVELFPKDWEVEFFIDDLEWQTLRRQTEAEFVDSFDWNGYAVFHFLQSFRRNRLNRFDAHIFHVEDSPRCAFVQQSLRLFPGICYFHDLNLRRLEWSRLDHATTPKLLNDRMTSDFGEDAIKVGDWVSRGWSSEVLDGAYPLGEEDRRLAAVAVVENVRSVEEFRSGREQFAEDHVELSAFPVITPPEPDIHRMRADARRERDLQPQTPVIAFLGRYLFEERIYVILEAVRKLPKPFELLWLVVTEEERLGAIDTIQRVFGMPLTELDFIRLEKHETQVELERAIAASDIMLGLRFDVLRGISLSTFAALSFGIPTILTEFGPGGEIPSPAVLHLGVGRGEKESLVKVLTLLLSNPALCRKVGRAGREFCQTVHSPEAVITDLESIFARQSLFVERVGRERQTAIGRNKEELLSSRDEWSRRRAFQTEDRERASMLANAKRDFGWGA